MPTARSRRVARSVCLATLVLVAGIPARGAEPLSLSLRSTAFANGAPIPRRHTCQGDDVSPGLAWSDPPAGTRSFALVMDDPDVPDPKAPKRTWVHWVVYDLPASARSLPEIAVGGSAPGAARSGANDWGRAGWGGPCPPIGRHRYFFKLYALDVELGDLGEPDKAALEQAMQGHVLGRAELIGTYEKER